MIGVAFLNRIPDTDPYWKLRPPATRKQCLHQQVTRAVPDFECHLGPRQILNQVSNFLDLSQIYNSKKSYFDAVNRDLTDRAKLILDNSGHRTTLHLTLKVKIPHFYFQDSFITAK